MIFSPTKSTEDLIVESLSESEQTVKQLHHRISKIRPMSIQAVYGAIRQLLTDGVIVKFGRHIGVSREWATALVDHVASEVLPPQLEEGESITYSFTSYQQLDTYWKHLHAQLLSIDRAYPVFYYDPHEMWVYQPGREESQLRFLESRREDVRPAYMVIGGDSSFDQAYRRRHAGKQFEIDLNPRSTLWRDTHMTVLEDYSIRTRIPQIDAVEVDMSYNTAISENELRQKLESLFTRKTQIQIVLERNTQKAKLLRKRLSRNFYIPAKIAAHFKLF